MDPTLAGLLGAAGLAALGWVGKAVATSFASRAKLREAAATASAETAQMREARPWALMEQRIEDLEGERDRLAILAREQSALIDRIRHERDDARREAVDWEIAAKRMASVREGMEDEVRRDHALILARLNQIHDAVRQKK